MTINSGIQAYDAEIANIKYFLREERGINEWQNWLHKRVPKLAKHTTKLTPSTMILGGGFSDLSCRYTDLLTLLCKGGNVLRTRTKWDVRYKWVD